VKQLCERTPTVIDAAEFLKAPEAQLRALCGQLDIAFTPRMLSWPAGPRASDGVWAPYWYEAVLRSTGFEPYRAREHQVPAAHQEVIDAVMPAFEVLWAQRLR
jgi:Sulfotransferase domain